MKVIEKGVGSVIPAFCILKLVALVSFDKLPNAIVDTLKVLLFLGLYKYKVVCKNVRAWDLRGGLLKMAKNDLK